MSTLRAPGSHRRAAPQVLAAALAVGAGLASGACARARPSPAARPDAAGASSTAASPTPAAVSPEESARRLEQTAARATDPVPPLLQVARLHRLRADDLAAGAAAAPSDAPPGATAADLLATSAQESAACAADARRAWTSLAPDAASALEAGADPAAAFARVPTSGAEALYLDALCAAAWARAQGFTQLIERHHELQAELARAAALAPAQDAAGPDRELGRLLAALPAYAGGNLGGARAHFEAALARDPGSIATRVLFARGVAVKQQDRALFESQLSAALAATAVTPADRTGQTEARALLAREDDLFGSAG